MSEPATKTLTKPVEFAGKTYDNAALAEMSTAMLIELNNDIAKETNWRTVKTFHDKGAAIARVTDHLLFFAKGGHLQTDDAEKPAPAAPKKTRAARAKKEKVAAAPKQPKQRQLRGWRFVFPVGSEIKKPKTGHRLKMFEMLQRDHGASFKELMNSTFADEEKSPDLKGKPELQTKATYECLRLLHYYNGYGLKQDDEGRIYLRMK